MTGPRTRHLIRLAQTLEEKWQLGFEVPETTDKYINAPVDDGYHIEEKDNNKKA